MNTKFTKGEWNLAEGKTYCAIRTEESIIADIRTVNGTYNKYDGHLIAAAPDMYAFIQSLLDYGMLNNADEEEAQILLTKARGE